LFADVTGRGRITSDERARADELLDQVGILDVADEPVEVLSLGHGRLVELARALVGSPKLLMLDEPSSGLDREETNHMVAVVKRVLEGSHTSVVLVEHDLPMVTELVQRLVVLESGVLLADGSVADVLADPEVRRAYLGEAA
jgi:branched-chain amino acid transport system ATP-binding protein